MAYATIGDVQALNRQRPITATSVPCASDVAVFLDLSAGQIDGLLVQKGYQLPVPASATVAMAYLRGINAAGAWAMAERSAPTSPHIRDAEDAYEKALKMLADADAVPDMPRDGAVAMPRGPGLTVPRVGHVLEPFFTRDMER